MNRRWWWLGLLVMVGCNSSTLRELMPDRTPARILVEGMEPTIFDQQPHPLRLRVVNAAGQDLGSPVSVAAIPADVMESSNGVIRCLKIGDATVVFSGGGLSSNSIVHCQPVHHVIAPYRVVLTVGDAPSGVAGAAYNERDEFLGGACPMQIVVDDPTIVSIDPRVGMRGLRLGETSLRYTLGSQLLARTIVSVQERFYTGPLLLGDGAQVTRALPAGRYKVSVAVEPSGGDISVTWVGAACPGQGGVYAYNVECVVPGAASMTITNPTLLGLGSNARGLVTISRAPEHIADPNPPRPGEFRAPMNTPPTQRFSSTDPPRT